MKTQKVGKNINMTYDFECTATQNSADLPFGEDWVDLREIVWDYHGISNYQFSGKEKDAETGFNYFGARYYDSDRSIWLRVDPMASKYPSISPYVYCANNPIKLVDPDGREEDWCQNLETEALESNWAVNNTNPVDCLDGINPNPKRYSPTQKNGVYLHRSNNNGWAGGEVSTGCILIEPSRYDSKGNSLNNGWDQFNKQLIGVSKFPFILKRD